MLIGNNKRYIEAPFLDENELEQVIVDNYEQIFGASSIFLPKTKIKTLDGAGTIPDGYAIDLKSQMWYIVEAELAQHKVYDHIASQVGKQIGAAQTQLSKKRIIELSINQFKDDAITKDKFYEMNIKDIDVRHVLSQILEKEPIVGIPIDKTSDDLESWSKQQKTEIKIWEVIKFVNLNNKQDIMYHFPIESKPILDTGKEKQIKTNGINKDKYDILISDLIEKEILKVGEKLVMEYKPRQGYAKVYEATLNQDGTINTLGQNYSSPSYAALAGIQNAGSKRNTVNGWTSWKNKHGTTLDELRENYLYNSVSMNNKQDSGMVKKTESFVNPTKMEPEKIQPNKNEIHTTEIFAKYKKIIYNATYYSHNKILFNGKEYPSPTAAGKAVTKQQTCNGPAFWKFIDKNGKKQSLDKLG